MSKWVNEKFKLAWVIGELTVRLAVQVCIYQPNPCRLNFKWCPRHKECITRLLQHNNARLSDYFSPLQPVTFPPRVCSWNFLPNSYQNFVISVSNLPLAINCVHSPTVHSQTRCTNKHTQRIITSHSPHCLVYINICSV